MMSSISRVVRAIRCWWPSGRGGAPGSVTSTWSATSFASSSAASRRSALCSISASSSLRALLAAPPTGPRSSGGSCAIPRRIWVSSALRPRNLTRSSSSSALEEAATIASVAGDPEFLDLLKHWALLAHPRARYSRGGGDVQRLGASVQGNRHAGVAGGERPRAAALPLGAQADGPGAGQRRQSFAPVGDQGDPRAGGLLDPGDARRRPGEERSHARPGGLRAVGIGTVGTERDRRIEERVGGADDRPDVAGIADPVEVDAGRRGALRSAGGQTAIPGSRSRARTRSRAGPGRPRRPVGLRRRTRSDPVRRCRGDQHEPRLAPAARPPRAGPRPRSRTGPRARGACARAACAPASASRCLCFRSSAVLFRADSSSACLNPS